VCVSIVRSGILDPWPKSPGFGPQPGPSPKKIRFSEHNLGSCYQNGTFMISVWGLNPGIFWAQSQQRTKRPTDLNVELDMSLIGQCLKYSDGNHEFSY
jgi:hypothetical protein